MKSVIILGDDKERLLGKTVIKACESYGGALVHEKGRVYRTVREPVFEVVDAVSGECNDMRAVLVSGSSYRGELSSGCFTVIADSGSSRLSQLLMGAECPVIGCSSSDRDTLSLSCRSRGRMLIALRRSILTLTGEIIEPCEIIVYTNEELPLFPVLAACGVLLLCGVPYGDGLRL